MTSASRAQPSLLRLLLLLPLLPAGVFSILGSSLLEDDDDDQGDVPVTVDIFLGSLDSPLTTDRGSRESTVTNLNVEGSYDGTSGNKLTINRDDLIINTMTGFDLELIDNRPDDDEFEGPVRLDVNAGMDLVPDRGEDPTMGQFETEAEGTTTIVTVRTDGDGVNVEVGDSDAVSYSWNDFEDLARDEDADTDLRFASSAYNELRDILVIAIIVEAELDTIDDNADMLESIGLNQSLELTCDPPPLTASTGGRDLFWRGDQAGAGQGDVGEGDSFEDRPENCYSRDNERFVDGTLQLENYVPAKGDSPRELAGDAEFSVFWVSESEVTNSTETSASSPRLNGQMSLSYGEVVVTTP